MYLPSEITNYIFEFYNPYKNYFTNNVLMYFKTKYNYNRLKNEFKGFVLHDRQGDIICFATDAVLSSGF